MLALVATVMTGCVQPGVRISGGLIHNDSGRELRNVRVLHHETSRAVSSNLLLPEADFILRFSEGELRARKASVSWDDPALGPQAVAVDLPREGGGDQSKWLVYRIGEDGQVTVFLAPYIQRPDPGKHLTSGQAQATIIGHGMELK